MAKKTDLSEEEQKLLHGLMETVTPLPTTKKIIESTPKTKAKTKSKRPDPAAAPSPSPIGIDDATKARVRRGDYKIAARLDLHGFTQEVAYSALENFIANEQHKGSRLVLVITGKGGHADMRGVLQEAVPRWLSHGNMARMVAFHTHAQARHGGAGALYVLLKRK